MKSILAKKIEEMKDNGLFLFDAPTGLGKTTSALKLIQDYLNGKIHTEKKQLFFITNLKKNLPIIKLQNLLDEKYHDLVLFLKPNHESVIEGWLDFRETFPDAIMKSKEFKELNLDVEEYLEYQECNKELEIRYKNRISSTSEPNFRSMIKEKLFQNRSFSEKKKIFDENAWISHLYPTSIIEKYKVVLTSTNRFLNVIDPIYKKPYIYYETNSITTSIIIIDEFDTTKNVMLDKIIDRSLNTKIDLIGLHLKIYYALQNVKLPAKFLKMSKIIGEDRQDSTIQGIIDKSIERFTNTYQQYNMNYLFKTINITDKSFIFNDGNSMAVLKESTRTHMYVTNKSQESLNIITTEGRKNKDNNYLSFILFRLKKDLDYLLNGLKIIALNYMYCRNEESKVNKLREQFNLDEAYSTIIDVFNVSSEERSFMLDRISNITKYDYDAFGDNNFFLKSGLFFIEIEDNNVHDLQSKMNAFIFPTTPEELLIKIAKQTIVIGLSATATLSTNIGNFDLTYVKSNLEKYYTLSKYDSDKINKLFMETQKHFTDDKVEVKSVVIDDYPGLTDEDIAKTMIKELCGHDNIEKYNYSNFYYLIIILKVVKVHNLFSIVDDIISGICFLNGFFTLLSKTYNLALLEELLEESTTYLKINKCNIKTLDSEEFDSKLLEIHQLFQKGEKCLVLSTYRTIGMGQNIQFDFNELHHNSIHNIDDKLEYKTKDFELVYLLEPTLLIQNLSKDEDKYKNLSKFLFQQQYLKQNKDIDYLTFKRNTVNAFRRTFYNDSESFITKKSGDTSKQISQLSIQAIGRICRSRYLNKKTIILADYQVIRYIQSIEDILKDRLLNFQFKKLLSHKLDYTLNIADKLSQANKLAFSEKLGMLMKLRSNKFINNEWEDLREYVLKNPTSDDVIPKWEKFYFNFDNEISKYYYKQGRNFTISDYSLNKMYNYIEVSANDSELSYFMKNNEIRSYFIDNHYAVTFKKNNFHMLPDIYHSIYKGALGEVVGKYILEEIIGDSLSPIKNFKYFEYFDFEYKGVYIDFKHWNSNVKDNNKGKLNVIWKENRIKDVKKIIIINLIKRGEHQKQVFNNGKVVVYPYLMDDRLVEVDSEVALDLYEEIFTALNE